MATSVACATAPSLHGLYSPAASLQRRPACSGTGTSLAPSKVSSPLKLVSNGSRVFMNHANEEKRILSVGSIATAAAVLVAAAVPEFAEAAQPGISSSLKNLLLSVAAGGVVVAAIGSAVAAVSTFDPVQRR